jgi:hypothetical protein
MTIQNVWRLRLSRKVVFEVCAEDLESCVAAREGGADRIELCCAVIEGGLTPSHALISAAVAQGGLPIYTILRPRGEISSIQMLSSHSCRRISNTPDRLV